MKHRELLDLEAPAVVPIRVGEEGGSSQILLLAVWHSPPVESLGIPVAVKFVTSEGNSTLVGDRRGADRTAVSTTGPRDRG